MLQLAVGVNARIFGIVLNGIPQGRAAGVYGYETYGYEADDRRFRQKRNKKMRRRLASDPASEEPAAAEHVDPVVEDEPELETAPPKRKG